jgi:hypothetical protein
MKGQEVEDKRKMLHGRRNIESGPSKSNLNIPRNSLEYAHFPSETREH